MTADALIYLVMLLTGITLLVVYSRGGKLVKSILFTVFSGFSALFIVLILARFMGLNISATPLSLLTSGILGVPGVFFMLVFNLL